MRDKLFRKGLVGGIICLLVLVTLPTSVSDNVTESNDNEDHIKFYFFCKVDISGEGGYECLQPIHTLWWLTEGTISIKSFYSRDEDTGQIIFFDKLITTEPTEAFSCWFIGTKSNDPFEMHGYALWTLFGI